MEEKQVMKDMEENIKEAINKNIDEKFDRIETKTIELEKKIEEQQKTIQFLDKQVRRKNIVFFGVPESEINYESLLNYILDIINKKMNIVCPKWEIEAVIRLGKNKDKIRPVIVTTTTVSRKLQLLKNKKTLENTGIYIKEDFSPAVLQKRRELQDELQKKRSSGEKVMLRYDKIVKIKSKVHRNDFFKKTSSSKILQMESPENTISFKTSNNEDETVVPREINASKRFLSESPEMRSNENPSLNVEQTKQIRNSSIKIRIMGEM
ncbi:hypothetical protein HW555_011971 [Spodoptera exigua]|uniref:Endonuclease-reverse transcriptase n=1 Tax=Spodoptera exigua TaxID=7107 RepID=A0A835G6K4_SPOEX|nr:hypothetical protein HW555_011971 [Spodoptera exigua]